MKCWREKKTEVEKRHYYERLGDAGIERKKEMETSMKEELCMHDRDTDKQERMESI